MREHPTAGIGFIISTLDLLLFYYYYHYYFSRVVSLSYYRSTNSLPHISHKEIKDVAESIQRFDDTRGSTSFHSDMST
jgi:hypothetical protein